MKKTCNFCGRSEKEVKLLISGIDGNICEDCAKQAYQIVQEHLMSKVPDARRDAQKRKASVPKPVEI